MRVYIGVLADHLTANDRILPFLIDVEAAEACVVAKAEVYPLDEIPDSDLRLAALERLCGLLDTVDEAAATEWADANGLLFFANGDPVSAFMLRGAKE